MSQTTMRIEIQKNNYRGWSCVTFVKYPDWPNEVTTSGGRPTLKSALWHSLFDCMDLPAKLLSVIVNGVSLPFDKVWEIVHKALTGGAMAYELPKIKELLEV